MFLQTKSYSADKFVRHGSILVRSEAMLEVALAWTCHLQTLNYNTRWQWPLFCISDLIFLKRWNSFNFVLWYFHALFFFKNLLRLEVSSGPCFHLSNLCMSLRCPSCSSVCVCVFITQRWTPEKMYGLKFTTYGGPPHVCGKYKCLSPLKTWPLVLDWNAWEEY